MRRIRVYDSTLRDGAQAPGFSMNMKTKLELAQILADLGVDVVEGGFPAASEEHFNTVKKISSLKLPFTLSALARAKTDDIDKAALSLEGADKGRIHIIVPSSDILIEKQFSSNKERILELTEESIKHALGYSREVQLSLMDAFRADPEFIKKLVKCAVKLKVSVLNCADSVGVAVPDRITEIYKEIRSAIPGDIELSIHCHNDLGLAAANTIAAAIGGADQIECTLGGIGERSGNAALEECSLILELNKKRYDLETGVNIGKIYAGVTDLFRKVGKEIPYNKPVVGKNAFRHEAGIHQHGVIRDRETYEPYNPQLIGRTGGTLIIGSQSGIHGVKEKLQQLGVIADEKCCGKILEMIKTEDSLKRGVDDEKLILLYKEICP